MTSHYPTWSRWLVPIALFVGLILSIISALELCTTDCAAAHEYRLWGLKFETIGIPFFIALLGGYWLGRSRPRILFLVLLGILGGVGAEVMFIYAQKEIIGHWCPVCLAIAGCLAIAATALLIPFLKHSIEDMKMNQSLSRFFLVFALIAGFSSAFFGFSKFDRLAASEQTMKKTLAFGDTSSPIEIYFFTDWLCPACRQIEPYIETTFPKITSKARFYFVDATIHPESLNFTPFNLSFITYNKKEYFKLRDALAELSKKTQKPTEEQVEAIAKKAGVHFKELDFLEVSDGIKYFKHLSNQFSIDRTPTMVIVNREAKKGKKLQGGGEITEENILKTIQALNK